MWHLYQKLKAWYRGAYIPYSVQEAIDHSIPRWGEPQKQPLPEDLNPR
jgi:hypothetical protein